MSAATCVLFLIVVCVALAVSIACVKLTEAELAARYGVPGTREDQLLQQELEQLVSETL